MRHDDDDCWQEHVIILGRVYLHHPIFNYSPSHVQFEAQIILLYRVLKTGEAERLLPYTTKVVVVFLSLRI